MNLRTPLSAILLDCDGTLVDSEEPGLRALHAEAVRLGLEMDAGEALVQFRGLQMARCLELIAQRLGRPLPDDFMVTVRSAMARRFREGISTIPGARELLQHLQRPGQPAYGVVSNGPLEKIHLTLGLTGLLPAFEGRIFSAYEVGIWKPDPGLFIHAAQALAPGCMPAKCLVVEDSLAGVQAGLAAGMQVASLCPAGALPDDIATQVWALDDLHSLVARIGN